VNSSGRKASTQRSTGRPTCFDRIIIRSAVCLLFVLVAATAFGQSGRRGAKSLPVSVPTPEAKQPEEKSARSDQPRINLLVGAIRGDAFAGIPLNIFDGVVQSCAGHLKDSSSVSVDVVTQEIARSDAANRAKAAKQGYVIWLNLRGEDQMGSYGADLDKIFIEYVVFEAVTAKVKTQGSCYQGNYRKGGVVIGPTTGRSNNVIVENRLRVAAEDAAARIMKALHIAPASDIPPH
jgi:hypothetical protein